MNRLGLFSAAVLAVLSIGYAVLGGTVYDFAPQSPIEYYFRLQSSITQFNCFDKPKDRLRMPQGTVSQLPEFNTAQLSITFPNRTGLQHSHDMALNRAFFFSYILQTFNVSDKDYQYMPGLLYYYLSVASDVSANPKTINGSTLMYDKNNVYPNWYDTLPFNKTMDYFAIRGMRIDDTFLTENFLREPTYQTIVVYDFGAEGEDYTKSAYRNAPWYGRDPNDPRYLPDSAYQKTVGAEKHSFNFELLWSPTERTGRSFFGPPYAGQTEGAYLPVRFTAPWFDCGRNTRSFNEWIVSSVSPVVDFRPRYSLDRRLQFPKYVAVAAMDTYFLNIPVNLCPISIGNTEPNLVANSALCKPTTVCETMIAPTDIQFHPANFDCRCEAGYQYSYLENVPISGSLYYQATKQEYETGFKCKRIRNLMVWPTSKGLKEIGGKAGDGVKFNRRRRDTSAVNETQIAENIQQLKLKKRLFLVKKTFEEHYNVSDVEELFSATVDYRAIQREARRLVSTFSQPPEAKKSQHLHPRFNSDWIPTSEKTKKPPKIVSRTKRSARPPEEIRFNKRQFNRMYQIFEHVEKVNSDNCHKFEAHELVLPGSVGYGADTQFHSPADTALRLSHFLSAYLQLNREEVVSGIRMGQPLHDQHIIGEALGNVAGNVDLVSSGVFFVRNGFVNSTGGRLEYFGPLVYRSGSLAGGSFGMRETSKFGAGYYEKPWFRVMKERWGTNADNLQKFMILPFIRGSFNTHTSTRYPHYPMWFRAPRVEDGYWSAPYFDCDGPVKSWLMTYSVPFFGRSEMGIKFMGVVTTTVDLSSLNVNQCPGEYYQANFFKDTALCDKTSTFCRPTYGLGFTWGSYECHCRAGFEFPYIGPRYFYLGSLMETEYKKWTKKEENIFGILKCRQGSATTLFTPPLLMYMFIALAAWLWR